MDEGKPPRKAWIEVIPESDAKEKLADLYDDLRSAKTGVVDHVLAIHSLHPETMRDHARLYRTLMHGEGDLSRVEREMIGVVVSAVNRCHYWVRHHAAGLARLTKRNRPDLTASLATDHRTAALSPSERAICDYAVKLTLTPWDMVESDIEPMRAAGLSDREILDVNLIVCYFAYVNRLADGLGIALEGDDDVLGW